MSWQTKIISNIGPNSQLTILIHRDTLFVPFQHNIEFLLWNDYKTCKSNTKWASPTFSMSIHTRILKILWCRNICSTTLIKIIVSRLVCVFASKKAKFLRILCKKINRQMFFLCLVRLVPFLYLIISSVYLHLRVCIHSETYIFIIITLII